MHVFQGQRCACTCRIHDGECWMNGALSFSFSDNTPTYQPLISSTIVRTSMQLPQHWLYLCLTRRLGTRYQIHRRMAGTIAGNPRYRQVLPSHSPPVLQFPHSVRSILGARVSRYTICSRCCWTSPLGRVNRLIIDQIFSII